MRTRSVRGGTTIRSDGAALVPGQTVRGRILEKLDKGHFRILARGLVFDAASDLPLEAGQRLTARVELDGNRLLLRVRDESGQHRLLPNDQASPSEIRRVLKLLGHHPDPLEILEFQERLERYRQHASLPGVEPSDVWILAILWTRGIRGGAGAFALFSYYLRQACLEMPRARAALPAVEEVYSALCQKADEAVGGECSPGTGRAESQTPGLGERKSEAMALLNRERANLGCYRELPCLCGTWYGMVGGKAASGAGRWRLADHPVQATWVLEITRAAGRIRIRMNLFPTPSNEQFTVATAWLDSWRLLFNRDDAEVESCEIAEVADAERLCSLFWRKWDKQFFCEASA